MRYSEFKHYNIVLGCNASRISVFDFLGSEYYAIIPMNGTGKQNRDMRNKALDAIELALMNDEQPGLVEVK